MSLRDFLELTEKEGEIYHVTSRVSPCFQISHILRNLKPSAPTLFFEKVKGHDTKVVANVCGTRERIFKSLNANGENLYEKLIDAWRKPKKPEIVESGSVEEEIAKVVDLSRLPILRHFEKDAGPYITAAVIHAKNSDENIENVSIHRLQVLDKKRLAIRLVPRHLFRLWQMAKKTGHDLEIAISVGVHPAVLMAASSPLPFGVCEYDVANALLNDKLQLVQCKHVSALAPRGAELVLEGKISLTNEVPEGPFVDVTGVYDIQRKQPIVNVIAVMHRTDYVYQGLLPSSAEHRLLMGLPYEAQIWSAVSKVVPRVKAVNLSLGGSGWLHAVIAIEKQVDGDSKNALLASFAAHPSLKHAVVVDSDINVYDGSEVEWAIATRFQASEDLIIVKNVRGSTLDSSADQETGLTTKMGLDATRPSTKPHAKFDRARTLSSKTTDRILQQIQTDLE